MQAHESFLPIPADSGTVVLVDDLLQPSLSGASEFLVSAPTFARSPSIDLFDFLSKQTQPLMHDPATAENDDSSLRVKVLGNGRAFLLPSGNGHQSVRAECGNGRGKKRRRLNDSDSDSSSECSSNSIGSSSTINIRRDAAVDATIAEDENVR